MKALLIGVFCVLMCGPALHADDTAEQVATKSALTWVALVDDGKYAESWDAAAALFKSQLSQEQWTAALSQVRAPLGKVLSRMPKSAQVNGSVPGAPGRQFVVIQNTTSFESRSGMTETVTMVNENGAWKAAGYFIQ